jgi:hypothetical protein
MFTSPNWLHETETPLHSENTWHNTRMKDNMGRDETSWKDTKGRNQKGHELLQMPLYIL